MEITNWIDEHYTLIIYLCIIGIIMLLVAFRHSYRPVRPGLLAPLAWADSKSSAPRPRADEPSPGNTQCYSQDDIDMFIEDEWPGELGAEAVDRHLLGCGRCRELWFRSQARSPHLERCDQ